jgi:hypothetical protein
MSVQKKEFIDFLNKALPKKSKDKKFFDFTILRISKKGIKFCKVDAETYGAFGNFSLANVGNPKIKKIGDVIITEKILENMKYIRDKSIIIESTSEAVLVEAVNKKDKFTIPIDSVEEYDEDYEKNIVFQKKEEGIFPVLEMSLESDKYDEEDEEYSPVLAYLILKKEELQDIPDCDSLVITGDNDSIYLESIEFGGSLGKYERTLSIKSYECLSPDFKIRIDKSALIDISIPGFSDVIHISITQKYSMIYDPSKGKSFVYMISHVEEKGEALTEGMVEEIEGLSDLVSADDIDSAMEDLEEESGV